MVLSPLQTTLNAYWLDSSPRIDTFSDIWGSLKIVIQMQIFHDKAASRPLRAAAVTSTFSLLIRHNGSMCVRSLTSVLLKIPRREAQVVVDFFYNNKSFRQTQISQFFYQCLRFGLFDNQIFDHHQTFLANQFGPYASQRATIHFFVYFNRVFLEAAQRR